MAVPTEVIAALIGAVAGGSVGWLTYRAEVANERVRELRDMLLRIIEVREQMSDMSHRSVEEQMRRGAIASQKRAIYLSIAQSLAGRAERRLTARC